jgi:PleD family two-component response regulator
MLEPAKILVVDDDRRICALLVETLEAIGYQAAGAFNALTALHKN